jgi:hypothetical protein
MKKIFIFTLLFIVATSKGQDKIAMFYQNERIDDTVLTLYSDNKYSIIFYFAADLPDFRTEKDDKILSVGNWTQKSDTILLFDTTKNKQPVNKTYKLLKVGENTLKNLTVEFFEKNDKLKMYSFSNLTQNWTFSGEIKYGLMTGTKIDLKNWVKYTIVNGIKTDSIKMKKK